MPLDASPKRSLTLTADGTDTPLHSTPIGLKSFDDGQFVVTDASDVVIEAAGGGADNIITSVSMTVADHVEAMHIASGISDITLTGSAGNDVFVGNGLANTFIAGAGDDVILAGNVTLADIFALFAI